MRWDARLAKTPASVRELGALVMGRFTLDSGLSPVRAGSRRFAPVRAGSRLVTRGSTVDSLRPIAPKWDSSHALLLWAQH